MYLFEESLEMARVPEMYYRAQGEDDELQKFHDAVRIATLGAIAAGAVALEDGAELIDHVTTGVDDKYFAATAATLEVAISSAQDDGDTRSHGVSTLKQQYVKQAAAGILTSAALVERLHAVKAAENFLSNTSTYVRYVSVDGYDCGMTVDGMRPQVYKTEDYLKDIYGSSSPEVTQAEMLQATHFVDMYPRLQGEYGAPYIEAAFVHKMLGRLDEDGDFEPTATLLSEKHPVRSGNSDRSA